MTFETNLAATQQEGTPELYEFTSGSTIERYTSWAEDISFLGSTYTATTIERSSFKQDTDLGKVQLTIKSKLSTLFLGFIANTPIEPVTVKIWRALVSDTTEYIKLFEGVIMNVSVQDGVGQAEVEASASIMEARFPRFIYQGFCNNNLFDDACGLVDTSYRVIAEVLLVGSAFLRVTQVSSFADGYFTGGRVDLGTDSRLITDHTGTDLSILIDFAGCSVGDTVYVFPGCNGNPETCDVKFGNLPHFNGMPYIRSHNPVVWGFH